MEQTVNDLTYDLVMREIFVNDKNKTNLGKYDLEYRLSIAATKTDEEGTQDILLGINVNLFNKEEIKREWRNIYYKPLIKGLKEYRITLDDIYQKIFEVMSLPTEDKLLFINTPVLQENQPKGKFPLEALSMIEEQVLTMKANETKKPKQLIKTNK